MQHTNSIAISPEVEVMSKSEGRRMLGPRVRDALGISLDEFIGRVDSGEYDDTRDDNVLKLVMLVPFAR